MGNRTCPGCGAADPGRFCGACGAAQSEQEVPETQPVEQGLPTHKSTDTPDQGVGNRPIQEPADDELTRISDAPRSNWQALPPLGPSASGGDSTMLGRTVPPAPGGGYPSGSGAGTDGFGSASYGVTPVYLAPPQERRSQAPLVSGVVVGLLAVAAGGWWLATQPAEPKAEAAAPTPTVTVTSAPQQQPSQQQGTRQPVPHQETAQSEFRPQAPQQAAPAPEPPLASPTQKGPTDADNAAAEQSLDAQYETDMTSYDTAPHAIVQLSAKHHGTVDRSSKTSRGTSKWQSVDILREHQALRARYGHVRLVKGRDVNSTNVNAADDWITIRDSGFSSKNDANAWCRENVSRDRNQCYGSVTK